MIGTPKRGQGAPVCWLCSVFTHLVRGNEVLMKRDRKTERDGEFKSVCFSEKGHFFFLCKRKRERERNLYPNCLFPQPFSSNATQMLDRVRTLGPIPSHLLHLLPSFPTLTHKGLTTVAVADKPHHNQIETAHCIPTQPTNQPPSQISPRHISSKAFPFPLPLPKSKQKTED